MIETLKENEYNLLPLNIGIENSDVNSLINLYNNKIRQREQFLITAGPKNVLVLKSENELNEILQNIENTLNNYIKTIDIKIAKIEEREIEFFDEFSNLPVNEKVLRSIERELNIKESLFLLLLQKKEKLQSTLQ